MRGMTAEVAGAVARYAERLHAVIGDRHTVASPLGAWLLLALCGARAGAGDALAEVLGMDPAEAAAAAGSMLDDPHPLVPSASGVWHRAEVRTEALAAWAATLPAATATGPMPTRAELDNWAGEHSLGMIKSFPLDITPDVVLLMASALATRVSWNHAFEVVPAEELGAGSAWAARLSRILRSPEKGHRGCIVATERAGDVIMHVAEAGGGGEPGLSVVSVAADPGAGASDVLAAAHTLALSTERLGPPGRRSLFDLPLGATTLWTITEEPGRGEPERHRAVMPRWSAEGTHDLTDPSLGFRSATRLLEPLLGLTGLGTDAVQAATATYSRYGFEAAAVTAFGSIRSVPAARLVRTAELRFGHPYAVVAVATDLRPDGPGPWHGMPVFSAWVREPEDVPESEAG
jgi:hypothetical protein